MGRSASSWAALAWCGDAGAARLHVEREARIASVASEADVEAVAAIADAQNRIVDELNRLTDVHGPRLDAATEEDLTCTTGVPWGVPGPVERGEAHGSRTQPASIARPGLRRWGEDGHWTDGPAFELRSHSREETQKSGPK